MIVSLTLENGRIKVQPLELLGPLYFDKYRAACESAGALFDRAAKANMAPVENLPRLLNALAKDGFKPRVHEALDKAHKLGEEARGRAVAAADGRIAVLAEALKRHGLAPFPFQVDGIRWLVTRGLGGLIGDEPGLGKTMQALGAIDAGVPVVIVAPAVAKGVWLREIARWRPDMTPAVLSGRGSFRVPQPGEAVILNPDILPSLEEEQEDGLLVKLKPFAGMLPGTILVADECHAFKSSKALRTKRFRALAKAVWAAGGKVWGLTGTPLLNRPEELASLLTTFGLFAECFGSWTRYLRVMNGQKAYFGGYTWGKPTPAAIEGIRRVMLRRLRADVLPQLPSKLYEQVDVAIDKATQKACEEAAAALQAAGKSLEMAVFESQTAGAAFEQLSRLRAALATAKLPRLLEMLPEYEDAEEPVLVFSAHRAPIDALATRPGWAVITGDTPAKDRTMIEDLFQQGKLKGIGATIQAAGVAITLTRAHQAIFVDLAWTPAMNQQAEDRICRIGQTRGVIIKTLVAPGLDEDVIALLRNKQRVIDQTVNAAATRPAPSQRTLL